jgi:hypothetical protein
MYATTELCVDARICVGDVIQQGLAASADDHLVAFTVKRLCKCPADTRGAAGDEDRISLSFMITVPSNDSG